MRDWLQDLTTKEIIGGIIVAILTSGATTAIGWLTEIGLYWIITGAIIVFCVVVGLLTPLVGNLIRAKSGVVRIDCFPYRFDPNRYAQDIIRAERVSVLWNTGSVLRDQGTLMKILPYVKRLLLPHPVDNPILEALAQVADQSPDLAGVAKKIHDVTRDAQAQRVEVRWWPGWAGNTVTISADWILVEQFAPYLWAANRPKYRIEKRRLRDLHKYLSDSYDRMWSESERPTL